MEEVYGGGALHLLTGVPKHVLFRREVQDVGTCQHYINEATRQLGFHQKFYLAECVGEVILAENKK